VKAVSIYEPLRRFHQIVRLTPFRFEDFCAALASEEQSALLAEIHIQLLKTMLREDDNNGTIYGPNEVKDSVQSILFFVDNLTWADSLRAYIESDSKWSELLKDITAVEYPFCGPELRIRVLSWLVDLLLTTNAVRETLLSEGSILHEDHCRSCNRLGELICCETCPAVYHLGCIDPPIRDDEDPPDDWKCTICKKHKLPGVMDCTSELEKAGLLIRHEKLGHDRHGRKYWFLTRRILVESDDGNEVWYYTTPLQVEELLHRLDEDHYEAALVEAIKNQKEEIYAHMAITQKVTNS
jgi:nucleosome-remodeling factor subunit BPTF